MQLDLWLKDLSLLMKPCCAYLEKVDCVYLIMFTDAMDSNLCVTYFHCRNDLLVISSLVVSLCPTSPFMVGEMSYNSLPVAFHVSECKHS